MKICWPVGEQKKKKRATEWLPLSFSLPALVSYEIFRLRSNFITSHCAFIKLWEMAKCS